ncbi:MAG: MFS transporter [Candidatus Thorarchaeota archaeon]
MSRIDRALGIEGAPNNAVRLARTMALLMPSYAMAFSISTTFWLIFIAEQLGGGSYIAGLGMVGILVVIQFALQTALDYPTGSLGDHIGQKFVIASALICYALMFWLTSTVTSTTPFFIFVAIYALFGIARSQESGAWGAWFDSNFRAAHPNDEDRKQYGVFQGKLGMLFGLANTIVLIPGGWLALTLGREWVFQAQAVICILLALVVLRVLNDLPEVAEQRQQNRDEKNYWELLKEGVMFLGSDKFVTYVIAGQILFMAMFNVYGSLILFPFYFVYLLTDVAVASFRTFMYIPQVPLQERSGVWAMKFNPKKWIPRFFLLTVGSTIPLIIMTGLLVFLPPPVDASNLIQLLLPGTDFVLFEVPAESIIPVLIIAALFIFSYLMGTIGGILTQRVMIDVIPNKIRNSVYSLQPTLVMIIAMPLMIFSGDMISQLGFPPLFIILSLVGVIAFLLMRKAFSFPIPKALDLDQSLTSQEDVDIIEEAVIENDP